MAQGDGNGWVDCGCGHRHWGRHGAAGLALVRGPGGAGVHAGPGPGRADAGSGTGEAEVLLQLRAGWTHHGGTWGFPGGARDSHESPARAALREADEEVSIEPDQVDVVTERVTTDHESWRYTVVVATPTRPLAPRAVSTETDAVAWFPLSEVAGAPLHPGLAQTWEALAPVLAGALRRPAPRPPVD